MSKVTNADLTRSGTGCFIAVPMWQQWASTIKLFTPICLEPNISKMTGGRDSVPMDHQQEMAYGESNDHVANDVTCP